MGASGGSETSFLKAYLISFSIFLCLEEVLPRARFSEETSGHHHIPAGQSSNSVTEMFQSGLQSAPHASNRFTESTPAGSGAPWGSPGGFAASQKGAAVPDVETPDPDFPGVAAALVENTA